MTIYGQRLFRFILLNSILLAGLSINPCPIEAQPSPPDVIGRGDRWLYGDLYLQKLFGEVSSATVADIGDLYSDDDLESILQYVGNEIQSATTEDYKIEKIVSSLYAAHEKFASAKTLWTISFPEGTTLKRDGAFDFEIGGMPYNSLGKAAHILPKYGSSESGIQFRLTVGEWFAGTEAHGLFELEAAAVIDFVTSAAGDTRLPVTTNVERVSPVDVLEIE